MTALEASDPLALLARLRPVVPAVYHGEIDAALSAPARLIDAVCRAVPLTPRQRDVLAVIVEYRARAGVSPTYHEIAVALGVSKVTVLGHLETLQGKGVLRWKKHKARALEVVMPAGSVVR